MENYVDAIHIRALCASEGLEILDVSVSEAAARHLAHSFPLCESGTIIDWGAIPSSRLNWTQASDDEAMSWALSTMVAMSPLGLLLYSPKQPCVVGPINLMIRHFDELVWRAPGCRVLIGVSRTNSGHIEFGKGVLEFNGKGELFALTDGSAPWD